MSRCASPDDPTTAARSLLDELQADLKRQGFEPRVIEGLARDQLAQLLDCPPSAVSALIEGKEGKDAPCARVICTLKARVSGGGGLKGARDQREREWQAIQRRQEEAMRKLEQTRDQWPRWSAELER